MGSVDIQIIISKLKVRRCLKLLGLLGLLLLLLLTHIMCKPFSVINSRMYAHNAFLQLILLTV